MSLCCESDFYSYAVRRCDVGRILIVMLVVILQNYYHRLGTEPLRVEGAVAVRAHHERVGLDVGLISTLKVESLSFPE